jgi:hypothetical protein
MKPKLIIGLALVLSCFCHAAIVYPKAPDGGQQLVREYVGALLREHPDGPALSVRGLKIEDLTIAMTHRWYGVGVKDLASGHLLSAATSGSSWRYVLLHGSNSVGVAQLLADEKTGKAEKCVALYETDYSTEALRVAEQLPQIKKADYEFRFLSAPAVYFQAVWLHGKSDDIIIPVGPTFNRWNACQPYSESQMLKLLKPEAKKVRKAPGLIN